MYNPDMPRISRINTRSDKQVLWILSEGFHNRLHGLEIRGLVGRGDEGIHGYHHARRGGGDCGYFRRYHFGEIRYNTIAFEFVFDMIAKIQFPENITLTPVSFALRACFIALAPAHS